MTTHEYHPIPFPFERRDEADMRARAESFLTEMDQRRSVRFFSEDPVPRDLVERAVETASTAPSGAHRQPWTFVAISDPGLKREIRIAAEKEEKESYERRMPDEWLEALRPFGTDWHKPYLETVPWIVVVFAEQFQVKSDGWKRKNYYVQESVGIACGLFVAAVHHMGLTTLTHTPNPMGFLSALLERPPNEKPYILFPVGYPSADATVPGIGRKPLEEVSVWK